MTSVTIVGGAGFIGTRLSTRLLACGISVKIVDKQESPKFPELSETCDVRDLEGLRRCIPVGSVIVNLAAEHRDDVDPKSLYYDVNVTGAENICMVARERGVSRIIFTSSVAVYGFPDRAMGEGGRINPFNDYGKSKYAAEDVYRRWYLERPCERDLIIIRPTAVFGEENRGNAYNLFKQIATGVFLMIGSGKNKKSLAYVENVAAFLQFCVTEMRGYSLYNYVDKPDFDMNELVGCVKLSLNNKNNDSLVRIPVGFALLIGKCLDICSWITGRKFSVSSVRVKKFVSNTVFSTSVGETGFVAPISLEEGLSKTIKYEFLNPLK